MNVTVRGTEIRKNCTAIYCKLELSTFNGENRAELENYLVVRKLWPLNSLTKGFIEQVEH